MAVVKISVGGDTINLTVGAAGLTGQLSVPLSNLQAFDLVAQTGVIAGGVASDLNPVFAFPAFLISEVASITGSALVTIYAPGAEQAASTGTLTLPSELDFAGEAVAVLGDLFGMVSAAAFAIPTLKIVASAGSIIFTTVGAAITSLQVGPILLNIAENTIIHTINDIESTLSSSEAAAAAVLGSAWNQNESTLAAALTQVSNLVSALNSNNNQAFISAVSAVSTAISNASTSLLNQFGANAAAQTGFTENGSSGQTNIVDGAISATGSISQTSNSLTSSGSIVGADPFTLSDTNMISQSGLATLSFDGQSGTIAASNSVSIIGDSTTFSDLVYNGTTIATTDSDPGEIAISQNDSPYVDVSAPNPANDIQIDTASDGSGQIFLGEYGDSNMQELLDYSPSSLMGDTISIVDSTSGTVDVGVEIQNGGTAVINSDDSLSDVSQDFSFSGASGLLELDSSGSYSVYGALTGDYIELVGVTSGQILQFASANDPAFIIEDGTQTTTISLPDYTGGPWDVGNILNNGNLVIEIVRDSVPPPPDQTIAAGQSVTGATIAESLTVDGTIDGNVTFDSGSVLDLSTTATFSEAIFDDFSVGDTIILQGVTSSSISFNTATGVLTIGDPVTLQFAEIPSGDVFESTLETLSGVPGLEIKLEAGTQAIIYTFTSIIDPSAAPPESQSSVTTRYETAQINDAGEFLGSYVTSARTNVNFIEINGTYTSISGFAYTTGINDSGEIIGAISVGSLSEGLILNNGVYTPVEYPGAIASGGRTGLVAINNYGEVVGDFYNSAISEGFIYSDGSFTSIFDPAGTETSILAINNSGELVGGFYNSSGTQGFIYADGSFTTVADPLESTPSTFLVGINDSSEIIGTYDRDGPYYQNGFIYKDGTFTNLVDPLAGEYGSTVPEAINASGEVVGYYETYALGSKLGFIYVDGTFISISDPVGDSFYGTNPTSINDSDQIAGYYNNGAYVPEGFIASQACFCSGTAILTPGGETAIESLREGDAIITSSGHKPPIKWIGKRSLDLSRHPQQEKVQPIRFDADCFANDVPTRNLFLSPDHALYIDGILVPAKALINGKNIRQLFVPTVTYYHIELHQHSIIFAENTPAESYLETGNRGAFENCADAITLHPDFAQSEREAKGCAPFMESGPQVEAIRKRILDRANIQTTTDPALTVEYRDGSAVIQSRHAIPGLITPDPRDRRRLGVKVASIIVGGRHISFDHPALVEGWHDCEPDGRWTDGSAVIPAALLAGANDVSVVLAATLPYPVAV